MVIQRWQSVFLLITAVMMACFTFMSIGQVQLPDYSLNFTTLGFTYEGEATGGSPSGYYQHTWAFFIVSLLATVLPLINIFLFRNLKLQKTVCFIEVFFMLALLAIGCTYGYYHFDGATVGWSSVIIAPFIGLVSDLLAYNRISADQKLLRAADRLR